MEISEMALEDFCKSTGYYIFEFSNGNMGMVERLILEIFDISCIYTKRYKVECESTYDIFKINSMLYVFQDNKEKITFITPNYKSRYLFKEYKKWKLQQ